MGLCSCWICISVVFLMNSARMFFVRMWGWKKRDSFPSRAKKTNLSIKIRSELHRGHTEKKVQTVENKSSAKFNFCCLEWESAALPGVLDLNQKKTTEKWTFLTLSQQHNDQFQDSSGETTHPGTVPINIHKNLSPGLSEQAELDKMAKGKQTMTSSSTLVRHEWVAHFARRRLCVFGRGFIQDELIVWKLCVWEQKITFTFHRVLHINTIKLRLCQNH